MFFIILGNLEPRPLACAARHHQWAVPDAGSPVREWADNEADELFANAARGFGDGPSFDDDVEYLLAHQRFQPEDGDQTDRHAKYVRWLHHSEHLTERERRQEALADEFAVLAEAIEECDSD